MKRTFAMIAVIALLFSGCKNSSDINERVIVQGIGIDKGTKSKYLVTVQTLNNDTYSGIGGNKVPENLVENYFLEGDSVAEALAHLPQRAGKEPLYTHTRIIIIGLTVARDGLNDILDFFSRDSSCNVRMYVAVCAGKASDIFSVTENKESIPSVEIENAVKSSRLSLNSVSVHIYELLKMMGEKTTEAYLPLLDTVEKDETVKGVNCRGAAVFKGSKEAFEIDETQVSSMKLISDTVENGTYTLFLPEKGTASFDIYKYKIKKTFRIDENGKPEIEIKIKCEFDNVEYNPTYKNEISEKEIVRLENLLEKQLERQLEEFLEFTCKEKNADCARIGRVVLLNNPRYYKSSFETAVNRFDDFVFNINADVTVRRIGQLN